ncbi:pirin family protein [Burkholderia sp. LMU1-1-1.1]|jgi:redox-sensitive bicupin YhaK (pirin superfamily)|uniref:pirin family protein n=1 Tax=Burkholderia sp. LMU1-1-1.1 TaxID=3135266 RepID=UPI003446416A
MISHRRWAALEKADLGWLRAGYHFQLSQDGAPAHGAIGPLIVWNDDEIAVGGGFPMHGHRDMEILTYVRQGVLGHKDDLGSEMSLRAGEVQVMSAGTGIRHAEFNQGDVPLKIYQIWLLPREHGGMPQWSTRSFPASERAAGFVVLASGDAEDHEALLIRADARLLAASLKAGQEVRQHLAPSRQAYLVVATGRIEVNGEPMGPRDGAAISDMAAIHVVALEDAELVMLEAC